MTREIDRAAELWEKTRDPKYKDLWYKLIKEWANGPHNIKRRIVSVSSCHKTDDGTYLVIGKRR
jgi:hypothetical protein